MRNRSIGSLTALFVLGTAVGLTGLACGTMQGNNANNANTACNMTGQAVLSLSDTSVGGAHSKSVDLGWPIPWAEYRASEEFVDLAARIKRALGPSG